MTSLVSSEGFSPAEVVDVLFKVWRYRQEDGGTDGPSRTGIHPNPT